MDKNDNRIYMMVVLFSTKKGNINFQNIVPDMGADKFGEQLPALL